MTMIRTRGQAIFSEFETKVAEILNKKLPKMEQARELDKLSQLMSGRLSKQNLEYMVSRGSTAARMAMTGAQGNPAQLQQGTASPLMAQDVRGFPFLSRSSTRLRKASLTRNTWQ